MVNSSAPCGEICGRIFKVVFCVLFFCDIIYFWWIKDLTHKGLRVEPMTSIISSGHVPHPGFSGWSSCLRAGDAVHRHHHLCGVKEHQVPSGDRSEQQTDWNRIHSFADVWLIKDPASLSELLRREDIGPATQYLHVTHSCYYSTLMHVRRVPIRRLPMTRETNSVPCHCRPMKALHCVLQISQASRHVVPYSFVLRRFVPWSNLDPWP